VSTLSGGRTSANSVAGWPNARRRRMTSTFSSGSSFSSSVPFFPCSSAQAVGQGGEHDHMWLRWARMGLHFPTDA